MPPQGRKKYADFERVTAPPVGPIRDKYADFGQVTGAGPAATGQPGVATPAVNPGGFIGRLVDKGEQVLGNVGNFIEDIGNDPAGTLERGYLGAQNFVLGKPAVDANQARQAELIERAKAGRTGVGDALLKDVESRSGVQSTTGGKIGNIIGTLTIGNADVTPENLVGVVGTAVVGGKVIQEAAPLLGKAISPILRRVRGIKEPVVPGAPRGTEPIFTGPDGQPMTIPKPIEPLPSGETGRAASPTPGSAPSVSAEIPPVATPGRLSTEPGAPAIAVPPPISGEAAAIRSPQGSVAQMRAPSDSIEISAELGAEPSTAASSPTVPRPDDIPTGFGGEGPKGQDPLFEFTAPEKKSLIDAARGLYRAGLLSNLTTQVRNIKSNLSSVTSGELTKSIAAAYDSGLSMFTGQRTIGAPSLGSIKRAIQDGAVKGLEEAKRVYKTGATADDLIKVGLDKKISSGIKPLDIYGNFILNTTEAGDKFFRIAAQRSALESGVKAQVLTEIRQGAIPRGDYGRRFKEIIDAPPADLVAESILQGERAVSAQRNAVSEFVNKGFQGVEKQFGKGAADAGKLATDVAGAVFIKTPINIAKTTFDYTIGGMFKTLKILGYDKAIKGKTLASLQKELAQNAAKATVGSATIFTAATVLEPAGLITGYYDPEDRGRNARDIAAGRPPLSFRLPGGSRWYSLADLGPLGAVLGIGATLAREYRQEDASYLKAAGKAGVGFLKETPLGNTVESIEQLMSGKVGQFATDRIASTVPSIVGGIAETIDPNQRDIRGQGVFAGAEKKIPFLRENLPVKTDAFGRPLPDIGFRQAIVDASRPAQPEDPVIGEMFRLDVGSPILDRKKQKVAGGGDVLETQESYDRRKQAFGMLYLKGAQDVISSPRYQGLSDEDKKLVLTALGSEVKREIGDPRPDRLRSVNSLISRTLANKKNATRRKERTARLGARYGTGIDYEE
jgi:hypothetical protein